MDATDPHAIRCRTEFTARDLAAVATRIFLNIVPLFRITKRANSTAGPHSTKIRLRCRNVSLNVFIGFIAQRISSVSFERMDPDEIKTKARQFRLTIYRSPDHQERTQHGVVGGSTLLRRGCGFRAAGAALG